MNWNRKGRRKEKFALSVSPHVCAGGDGHGGHELRIVLIMGKVGIVKYAMGECICPSNRWGSKSNTEEILRQFRTVFEKFDK